MSLFDTKIIPREITLDEEINRSKGMSLSLFKNLKEGHTNVYNNFWENRRFTPQQMADGYGKDATKLFILSVKIQEILKIADEKYEVLPAKYEVTLNEDGTVTIGEKI